MYRTHGDREMMTRTPVSFRAFLTASRQAVLKGLTTHPFHAQGLHHVFNIDVLAAVPGGAG